MTGVLGARHAAAYGDASRQADNAARAMFTRRTPAEQQRIPWLCIPSGGGRHRQLSMGHHHALGQMHGLAAARWGA